MKTIEKQALELLRKYSEIKDDLLDYTDELHDGMLYDIRGYYEELDEGGITDKDLAILKKQVNSFELILKGYKGIKYIYG